jgi:hypothetical protein
MKCSQRALQHSKKRIFQKKISIEERIDPKEKNALKVSKKYSCGVESEKNGGSKKEQNFSLSTKQIYTRRTVSPIKSSNLNKNMAFNLGTKNLSYTARK